MFFHTKKNIIAVVLLCVSAIMALTLSCDPSFLDGTKTDGTAAVSSQRAVSLSIGRLTGVNWFGFETSSYVVHGLWSRDYKSMLQQIHDLGFNCIRIPWSNAMIGKNPNGIQINAYGVDAYTGRTGLNTDLEGLSSLEVLDKIIQEAGNLGLYIILDNHSRAADGYMNETLWYTDTFSEDQWISDWVMMATRYKNQSNVIGADLNNEPHGNTGTGSKPPAGWGYDTPGYPHTDWKAAAERCGQAVLAANPNLYIIVEGVEQYDDSTYWWGGNLSGVRDYPITAIPANRLIYSPHEYGPEVYQQSWFSDPSFPANMPAIWDQYFWFIYKQNIGPVLFGEFGIKEASAADPSSTAYKWFTTFMQYVGSKASWTFWCMNPNSGDTGGILKDDWVSVNTAKYNLIKPYLAGAAPTPTPTSTPTPTATPTPTPTATPTPTPTSTPTPTPTPTVTPTPTPPGGTCDNPEAKSIPLVYDGAGEYCWTLSSAPNFINSWNLAELTVNGVDFTNKWAAGSALPQKINGLYYIHYRGNYPWSHFEAK